MYLDLSLIYSSIGGLDQKPDERQIRLFFFLCGRTKYAMLEIESRSEAASTHSTHDLF